MYRRVACRVRYNQRQSSCDKYKIRLQNTDAQGDTVHLKVQQIQRGLQQDTTWTQQNPDPQPKTANWILENSPAETPQSLMGALQVQSGGLSAQALFLGDRGTWRKPI